MTEQQPEWWQRVQSLIGREYGPVYGWDPVNEPMIRHWCEAMGVDNPVYTNREFAENSVHGGIVAPPTMLQVWVMAGLRGEVPEGSSEENPYEVLQILEEAGYPAVVAVNSEQTYDRYLRPGDRIHRTSTIESVSEQKATALGVGHFVTELMTFYDQDGERVGTMRFRLFLYEPAQKPEPVKAEGSGEGPAVQAPKRPRPAISDDTRFFWDGLAEHRLRIQKCSDCGELRHPPGPVCANCHSLDWTTVDASGRGELYSFVVMHYPEVPPFEYPNLIGLVELEEGTRLVARLAGVDRSQARVGMPVRVDFEQPDEELTLPVFRPVAD